MSASLELIPDSRVFFHGLSFIASLMISHWLILKPMLGLHQERKKRTSGALVSALATDSRAVDLEQQYTRRLQEAVDDARDVSMRDVLAGQATAESIVRLAHDQAQNMISAQHHLLHEHVENQKVMLNDHAKVLVQSLLTKLCWLIVLMSGVSQGQDQGAGVEDFAYSVFWPYVQFGFFVLAIVIFGKKPLVAFLSKRRDALKTQLSEAKQAIADAAAKIKEIQDKLDGLEHESQEKRAQIIGAGVREREKIMQDAHAYAQRIHNEAQQDIKDMFVKAREDLKHELVSVVMASLHQACEPESPSLKSIQSRLWAKALASVDTIPSQDAATL